MARPLAYFAGFFDGEGYVGVGTRDADKLAVLKATVTNDHLVVCEAFKDRFGGFLREPKMYGSRQGKTSWTWIIYSQQAKEFLSAIQRHVIVKRPQIDVAAHVSHWEAGRSGKSRMVGATVCNQGHARGLEAADLDGA